MKNFGEKIAALMVVVLLAFSILPGKTSYADDTINIAGNPVGSIMISAPLMKASEMGISMEVPLIWNDAWFFESATEYNQELAVAEVILSSLAYIDKEPVEITKALVALGFDPDSIYADYTNPTMLNNDIASFTIAKKQIEGSTLVSIVIKGTSGNEEWVSNMNVGENNEKHLGFSLAAIRTYLALSDYLNKNSIDVENAKFLVTGHSRGAGVANVLAATIQKELKVSKDNLFAYTFAAPRTTKESDAGDYNIFNIVSSEDMVTILPFGEWGYSRYGKDLVLPGRSFIDTQKMDELTTKVDTAAFTFTGMHFFPKTAISTGLIVPMNTTKQLVQMVPNVATFNMLLAKSNFSFSDYFSDDEDNSDGMMLGLIGALTGEEIENSTPVEVPTKEDLENGNFDASAIGSMGAHATINYYAWLAATVKDDIFRDALNNKDYYFDRVIIENPGNFSIKDSDGELVFSLYQNAVFMSRLASLLSDGMLYLDFPGGISDYYLETLKTANPGKNIQIINYKMTGADVKLIGEKVIITEVPGASETVETQETVEKENATDNTEQLQEIEQVNGEQEAVDNDAEGKRQIVYVIAGLVVVIVVSGSVIFLRKKQK